MAICENCKDSLEGKKHVIVGGKTYCGSAGRIDALNEAGEVFELVRDDENGARTLENFVSPRRG
jgi:hypothetical protein